MKVRFVLPAKESGGTPRFDQTFELPAIPAPGQQVGLPTDLGDDDTAWVVEVDGEPRWFLNGEEPVAEVWLSDDAGVLRRHGYRAHTCRYGFEQMMNNRSRPLR